MVALTTRVLVVYFKKHMVGQLQEYNNIWQFTYNDNWLEEQHGFDISPHLFTPSNRAPY